jgi:hypothetical protein
MLLNYFACTEKMLPMLPDLGPMRDGFTSPFGA